MGEDWYGVERDIEGEKLISLCPVLLPQIMEPGLVKIGTVRAKLGTDFGTAARTNATFGIGNAFFCVPKQTVLEDSVDGGEENGCVVALFEIKLGVLCLVTLLMHLDGETIELGVVAKEGVFLTTFDQFERFVEIAAALYICTQFFILLLGAESEPNGQAKEDNKEMFHSGAKVVNYGG